MAEAAAVCLDDCSHPRPVRITVDGDASAVFDLQWRAVDDRDRRTWADEGVATEYGACAIAILVVRLTRGHTVLQRSRKGTGFDYWMGDSTSMPFTEKARLEVSGIRRGSSRAVSARVKQKVRQISVSSGNLPGIVVVFEFGTPLARMVDQ